MFDHKYLRCVIQYELRAFKFYVKLKFINFNFSEPDMGDATPGLNSEWFQRREGRGEERTNERTEL